MIFSPISTIQYLLDSKPSILRIKIVFLVFWVHTVRLEHSQIMAQELLYPRICSQHQLLLLAILTWPYCLVPVNWFFVVRFISRTMCELDEDGPMGWCDRAVRAVRGTPSGAKGSVVAQVVGEVVRTAKVVVTLRTLPSYSPANPCCAGRPRLAKFKILF